MADEQAPEGADSDDAPAEAPPSLHDCPLTISLGQRVLHPSREQLLGVVAKLGDDGYHQCVDSCGVD